jgi:hypothetical protein
MKKLLLTAFIAISSGLANPAAADYTIEFMGTCAAGECIAQGVEQFQCFEKSVPVTHCVSGGASWCTVTVHCKVRTPSATESAPAAR